MKNIIIVAAFLTVITNCKAQNVDSIYSFMNNELPHQEFGKSSWGIFFLAHAVILDSEYCNKIINHKLENIPVAIQQELYKNCLALTYPWQNNFHWEQSKMKHQFVISDTKHTLPLSLVAKLNWTKAEIKTAKYWVNEWNKSKIDERLINYSSVPVFSNDGQYVLIFRGQDVKSEGGWDTIYIYKKEKNKWIIAERLIISQI